MSAVSAAQTLDGAGRLMRDGRWPEAVDLLMDANRTMPDPEFERLLVIARHRAFVAPESPPTPEPWPAPVADAFPDLVGVPEVAATDITPALLASGLQHHGAVIVRGLVSPSVAGALRAEVELAFDAAEAAAAGAPAADTSPSYVRFTADDEYEFGGIDRHFSRQVGAVLGVEAPRVLFQAIEALHAAGVGDLIRGYVGEWPALSAKKTTLRRAGPDSPTEWHQDGAFLGAGIRTVNVWTALTSCGTDAPGVDVFARRFDHIVETGTDDALFNWSVSPEQAERLDVHDVVRPEFEAGDALLFDQMTLHRTAISPTMTDIRYALESWFFAPSSYPFEQVPIAF